MPTYNRTAAVIIWLAAGLAVLACNPRPSGDRPGAALSSGTEAHATAPPIIGTWTLEAVPPQTSPGRMRLDLRVDSVAGPSLHGQLVHYFAGDVGVDHATFPHFEGEIQNDSLVLIVIRAAARPTSGFHFTGVLGADTMPLTTFVVGPDTVSGPDRHWRLVRKKD